MLYFAGYASWNYFTTSFLLAMAGVETKEIELWQENGETWHRLAVSFPETIPTHYREQVFYFNDRMRLRRFDYAPEVYASWAKAAHYCSEYENFSGCSFLQSGMWCPAPPTAVPVQNLLSSGLMSKR